MMAWVTLSVGILTFIGVVITAVVSCISQSKLSLLSKQTAEEIKQDRKDIKWIKDVKGELIAWTTNGSITREYYLFLYAYKELKNDAASKEELNDAWEKYKGCAKYPKFPPKAQLRVDLIDELFLSKLFISLTNTKTYTKIEEYLKKN